MKFLKFSTTTIFALLLTVVLCGQIEAARLRASNNPPGTLNFLNSMCAKTTYTRVCVSSLSPYKITISNSTVNLARAAVSVSLDAARSASSLVTRLSSNGVLTPSETFAVRDCVPTMGDCVMVLQKSLDTMVTLNESKLAGNWIEMDNIKTWVSAAMTDENTCLSGFTGGETTAAKRLKRNIMDAMQRTSNTLALLALIGPGST
ncbi:pectinesterase inhibitor 10-like [Carex rostrata]